MNKSKNENLLQAKAMNKHNHQWMYSDKLNSDISSQSWVKTGNADQETICEPQQSTKKKQERHKRVSFTSSLKARGFTALLLTRIYYAKFGLQQTSTGISIQRNKDVHPWLWAQILDTFWPLFWCSKFKFPYRESNPGRLGENQES